MCSNPKTPYLGTVNKNDKTFYWFKADCKLWSCEECAEIRKTRVMARAGVGTEDFMKMGINVNGITLTCHEKVRGFNASIERWREAWPRLRKRAQYREDEFHYCFFPEQHKTGALHAHLLATGNLRKRFWKDHSRAVGLGFMAHVKPVYNYGGAARYATKYISKTLDIEDWPPKFHRFRFSSKWPKRSIDSDTDSLWRVFTSEAHLHDEMRHWHISGYRIANTRTGELS